MAKVDLAREFVATMKAGGCSPKIEADRILVIYHDAVYYAYQSDSVERDKEICEAFLYETERETGVSDYEILHWSEIDTEKHGGLLKSTQRFDGDFDYDTYFVVHKEG